MRNTGDRDILIDLKSLMDWGCIPKSFPYPPDKSRRTYSSDERIKDVTVKEAIGSKRSTMKFSRESEEDNELKREL